MLCRLCQSCYTDWRWWPTAIPKESFIWIAVGWREARPRGRADAVTHGHRRGVTDSGGIFFDIRQKLWCQKWLLPTSIFGRNRTVGRRFVPAPKRGLCTRANPRLFRQRIPPESSERISPWDCVNPLVVLLMGIIKSVCQQNKGWHTDAGISKLCYRFLKTRFSVFPLE